VKNADVDLEMRGVGPQGCEAGVRPLGKRDAGSIERVVGSTPFRPCGARGTLDKIRKPRVVRYEERAKGQSRRCETFGRASRSAKRLSDTEWPLEGTGPEAA
jgi:hypothetical protein